MTCEHDFSRIVPRFVVVERQARFNKGRYRQVHCRICTKCGLSKAMHDYLSQQDPPRVKAARSIQ